MGDASGSFSAASPFERRASAGRSCLSCFENDLQCDGNWPCARCEQPEACHYESSSSRRNTDPHVSLSMPTYSRASMSAPAEMLASFDRDGPLSPVATTFAQSAGLHQAGYGPSAPSVFTTSHMMPGLYTSSNDGNDFGHSGFDFRPSVVPHYEGAAPRSVPHADPLGTRSGRKQIIVPPATLPSPTSMYSSASTTPISPGMPSPGFASGNATYGMTSPTGASSSALPSPQQMRPPPPVKQPGRRGRKQDDTLELTKARETQRAFRARRAARLAWLEARVAELEQENGELKAQAEANASVWGPAKPAVTSLSSTESIPQAALAASSQEPGAQDDSKPAWQPTTSS